MIKVRVQNGVRVGVWLRLKHIFGMGLGLEIKFRVKIRKRIMVRLVVRGRVELGLVQQ